jgi:hypothetical protein
LEARTLLSTCFVTRLTDLGAGSGQRGDLRYCIAKTNNDPGEDRIEFPPNLIGTIQLASELPDLADDLIVIGPGADKLTVRRLDIVNLNSIAGGGGVYMAPGSSASIFNRV